MGGPAGAETLTQIDASDGHVVGGVYVPDVAGMIGAYDAVWLVTVGGVGTEASESEHPVGLVRVNADLTTTTIEIAADRPVVGISLIAAGAGSIWMPWGPMVWRPINPETLETTWISPETIGHEARVVAVDGDAVFVASDDQITALVDARSVPPRLRAAISPGDTWGMWTAGSDSGPPRHRRASRCCARPNRWWSRSAEIDGVPIGEIDGDGWAQTGPLSIGPWSLLPDSTQIPPSPGWAGPVSERGSRCIRCR